MGAEWLTVAESVNDSNRSLVEIVDAMLAGELPYQRIGDDPMQWFIERTQMNAWLARDFAGRPKA